MWWLALPAFALMLVLLILPLAERRKLQHRHSRRRPHHDNRSSPSHRFAPPKPPWVRREVLRLKAWMPHAGCRTIALTFNHLHEERRGMRVGKTFVAGVLRHRAEEVMRLRRELRRRRPRRMARNVLWGLDWTYVPGLDGEPQPVLGVIDHGTRACLELRMVESKKTVAVLRQIFDLFARFGTPKVVRTDNEPACRSRLFRLALRLLGVRHTRTAPLAPWQNGRVERMFGTFKELLRRRGDEGGVTAVSQDDLHHLRTWYNHLRPHQNLDGLTPAEAWRGKVADRRKRPLWISDWGGLLAGYYWPS